MTEIDFIEAMSVLTIQPGDVVVFKSNNVFTLSQRQFIERHFAERLNAPVVLLDNGIDLGILRQAADSTGYRNSRRVS